jgi:hypothetical protein
MGNGVRVALPSPPPIPPGRTAGGLRAHGWRTQRGSQGCVMTSAPTNRGSTLSVDLGPSPDQLGRWHDSQLEEVMAIVGQILGLVL